MESSSPDFWEASPDSTISLQEVDPSDALTSDGKPLDPPPRRNRVREQYLSRMGMYHYGNFSYVPNVEPLLRWGASSPPSTPGTLSSPPGSGVFAQSSPSLHQMRPLDVIPEPNNLNDGALETRGCFGAGSMKGSIVNIAAATLGAGALSLPRAFYYAGNLYAVLFMVALVALAIMSITVIIHCINISKKETFEQMAKKAFGSWFTLLFEVNIILFCFGTAVGYMMTVGNISSQVVERIVDAGGHHHSDVAKFLMNADFLLSVITVVLLFPLSMMRQINELRYASLLGVSCILVLVLVVIYVPCRHGRSPTLPDLSETLEPKDGIMGIFKMLSLAIFAFCCQPNVPAIYCELERKSLRRMKKIGSRGMLLCLTVYIAIGMSGFLAFGENTNGNIMENLHPLLKQNDPVVIIGFACMAFAVTMAFPLNIFPIRECVETILFYHKPELKTPAVQLIIGSVLVGLSLLCAIVIPSINLVFELVGATTGSFTCFIGPGLLFINLDRSPPGRIFQRSKLMALFLIGVGTVFLVLGTYSSVVDIMQQLSPPAPKHGHTNMDIAWTHSS